MKNIELAQKIVAKYGEYSKEDHKAIDELDADQTVHTIRLMGVAGIVAGFHGKTKKEVTEEAVKLVKSELDEGNVVLSDTWAEDNL